MTSTVKVQSHNFPVSIQILDQDPTGQNETFRTSETRTLRPEDGEQTLHCTTSRLLVIQDIDETAPATEQRTENVYEGTPDGRQSTDPTLTPSRFRPAYRQLTPDEKALHDALKTKAVELETLIDQIASTPAGVRYRALAITDLEKSIMWAVKALTA